MQKGTFSLKDLSNFDTGQGILLETGTACAWPRAEFSKKPWNIIGTHLQSISHISEMKHLCSRLWRKTHLFTLLPSQKSFRNTAYSGTLQNMQGGGHQKLYSFFSCIIYDSTNILLMTIKNRGAGVKLLAAKSFSCQATFFNQPTRPNAVSCVITPRMEERGQR